MKLSISPELVPNVVFHCQLRCISQTDQFNYNGVRMDRFVFQGVSGNVVSYNVHVPGEGEYFLEIFANKLDDPRKIGETPTKATLAPFRLKCACKFRIICSNLRHKMHPLPDCSLGIFFENKIPYQLSNLLFCR